MTTAPRNDRLSKSRRGLLAGAAALAFAGCARAEARELTVYKTPWCGCCKGWVTHMTRSGFRVKVVELEDLAPIREQYGVPFRLSSCHTGVVGGYVVEGHVPPADVARLLRERPRGLGLTVPGMPIGSPGMEQPGGATEPYETLLLLDRTGRTRTFARHG
ncbi:MAG: DUF411 domain-containing protein [Phenylobacterium sp.]|jgi:hypothetical protein|uniref:DUF411 domain-containing protein n=1 Tax=Phenylobacterium sp. TaxID=1871053 RepID=UPI001A25514F|nr:DUF411 domain-containing protein [Phenylobacterium sp.]MBJ7412596.1 DUF411 domain-containing protein [Phenylobacterium sp.]